MFDLDKMTKDFLLNEGHNPPDVQSFIQSIAEILERISPRSQMDAHRLSMAKENLRQIRRSFRRLQEENAQLKETLKENQTDDPL